MGASQVKLCDNNGNLVGNGMIAADPIAASGITLASGTAGSDVTQAVTSGGIYAITTIGSAFLFSITGVTSTAANIEWVINSGDTIVIKIPFGKTILYFEGDTSSKFAYMRKLA